MPTGRTSIPFVVLVIVLLAGARVPAADRFVAANGDDGGNDCLVVASPCASLARAIGQSSSGDTINVSAGSYRETVRLDATTDLRFRGGWASGFGVRDPHLFETALRPAGGGARDRVWAVEAEAGVTIALEIDGFILTGGLTTTQVPFPAEHRNDDWRDGGGLSLTARGGTIVATVRDTLIKRNRALVGGGGLGVHAFNGGSLDLTLDRVVIVANRAAVAGGGLILAVVNGFDYLPPNQLRVSMVNTVIAKNTADSGVVRVEDDEEEILFGGGAMWLDGYGAPGSTFTLDLVDSTVVRNKAKAVGGINLLAEMGTGSTAAVTIHNTILYGNQDRAALGDLVMQVEGGSLTVDADHSDLGLLATEEGTFNDLGSNLSVDPGLDSHHHLRATSPLIDAGTCAGAPAIDIDGDPRPSGISCDVGADERLP